MPLERVDIGGVPVDILPPDGLEAAMLELLAKDKPAQIVFLSVWGLLKARKKNTYAQCVKNADMVIPVSKSIVKGAAFLGYPRVYRYEPFETVVSMLTILERYGKSLYLLGGTKKTVLSAERNVRVTYPDLPVVGRYFGRYHKRMEQDIRAAVYKSAPSLVLLSSGVCDGDCWFYTRREHFRKSIFVYYKDAIPIFAEKKKHISKAVFEKGSEIYGEIIRNPLKIFSFFSYLHYWYILLRQRSYMKKQTAYVQR
ncbi:MAG TPA: WecB/TagA/CpsF family glycosyltransferase [Candidatus Treponema faecavium]|nr:WecB/TagA/CpsF family glycosyltransferase [Candidatus Treponema faecavium]